MKWLNGKAGMVGRISAVLGAITAVLVLYWQISDRVDTKISNEVEASEYRLTTKIEITEKGLVSSLNQFRRQQATQYWMNVRDQARTQLRRVDRELRSSPNDPFLIDERAYWLELYNRANEELRKLLGG